MKYCRVSKINCAEVFKLPYGTLSPVLEVKRYGTNVPLSTIRPCSSTKILLALTIVESRCATTTLVRVSLIAVRHFWIARSVAVSNAEVA